MIPKLAEVGQYNAEELLTPEQYYDEIFGEDFNEERLFYLLGWGSLKLERDFEYDDEGDETNPKWIASTSEWGNLGFEYVYEQKDRLDAMKGVAVLWYLCSNTYEGYVRGLETNTLEDQLAEIERLQKDMQDMIRITKEKV